MYINGSHYKVRVDNGLSEEFKAMNAMTVRCTLTTTYIQQAQEKIF